MCFVCILFYPLSCCSESFGLLFSPSPLFPCAFSLLPPQVIKLRTTQRPTTIAAATAPAGGEPKDKSLPMELFLQGHAVSPKQLDALLPSGAMIS